MACSAAQTEADTSGSEVNAAPNDTVAKAKAFKKWVSEHAFRTSKDDVPDCKFIENSETGKCPYVISPYDLDAEGKLHVTFYSTKTGYLNFDSLDAEGGSYLKQADGTEGLMFRAGFKQVDLWRKKDGTVGMDVGTEGATGSYKLLVLDRVEGKALNSLGALTPEVGADFKCKSLEQLGGVVAAFPEKSCDLVLGFEGVGTEAAKVSIDAYEHESARGVRIFGSDIGQAEGTLTEIQTTTETVEFKTTLDGKDYFLEFNRKSHQVQLGATQFNGVHLSELKYK